MPQIYPVSTIVDMASEHENMSPLRAIQLFNEAHHYICGQCKLYPTLTAPVSLVQGTQEYSLNSIVPNTPSGGILKIWQAFYYTSPGAWIPVYPKNVDTLYQDAGPGWELTSQSTPYAYYERGGNLGFYPTPNVTTGISGYPNVTIEYDTIPVLGESDSLPPVDTVYPWVYYMCWLQVRAQADKPAQNLDLERKAYWEWFQESMKRLRESVYGRVPRDRPRVAFDIRQVRRA